jgi:hypothetical protein
LAAVDLGKVALSRQRPSTGGNDVRHHTGRRLGTGAMVRDDRRATCPKHPSDTPTETTTSAGYHRDSSRQIHITNPCSPTTNADPVLMDGNHSIERSAEVARAPLRKLMAQLELAGVDFADRCSSRTWSCRAKSPTSRPARGGLT